MRITLKEITLQSDTLACINNGDIDINRYIEYIKTNLASANYLIETKLISLEPLQLFKSLSKIFDIKLEKSDFLTILSEKYHRHYTGITPLPTNMVDSDGNNIVLVGASTKKVLYSNENISLRNLRQLVNSYDFLILETRKIPQLITNPEPFEDYQYERINLDFDKEDDLFEYKINLLGTEIRNKSTLKRILDLVNQYVSELIYQAKSITKLGKDEDNDELKEIASQYKIAYENNFSNRNVYVDGNHRKAY